MILARLLTAALLICSALTFAQAPKQGDALADVTSTVGTDQTSWCAYPPRARLPERWMLTPNQPADPDSGQDAMNRIHVDQFKRGPFTRHFNPKAPAETLLSDLKEQIETDRTCYTIRSYVVARDEKGSDSTHPAGYSTCRPSDRYHVKSAEMRVNTGNQ